ADKRRRLFKKVDDMMGQKKKKKKKKKNTNKNKNKMMTKKKKKKKKKGTIEKTVRQAFRMTDADGDSVLTAEEIREMLMTSDKTITSEELATLEQFLWKHDSDGDKVLDYGEFVNGFEQFHDQLRDSSGEFVNGFEQFHDQIRDSSVKAAGMIAYQKLAQTGNP
ncbi:hypothetical protein T484DRAFT_1859314, partial [Baffinella frigidus]